MWSIILKNFNAIELNLLLCYILTDIISESLKAHNLKLFNHLYIRHILNQMEHNYALKYLGQPYTEITGFQTHKLYENIRLHQEHMRNFLTSLFQVYIYSISFITSTYNVWNFSASDFNSIFIVNLTFMLILASYQYHNLSYYRSLNTQAQHTLTQKYQHYLNMFQYSITYDTTFLQDLHHQNTTINRHYSPTSNYSSSDLSS